MPPTTRLTARPTTRTRRSGRTAMTAVALLLAATACSSGTAAPDTHSRGEQEDRMIASPLAAYRLTPPEFATVMHAREAAINACLERFGFERAIPPFSETLQRYRAAENTNLSRTYGITDRKVAEAHGYSVPDSGFGAAEEEQLSEALLTVLRGGTVSPTTRQVVPADDDSIPEGGCSGEADRRLLIDPDRSLLGLGHELWGANLLASRSTPEHQDVVAEWTSCMAEDGYTVTSPYDDQGDIARATTAHTTSDGRDNGAAAPRSEVTLALADIDCKDEVKLVSRLAALQRGADEASIEKNSEALTEDRARLDTQLRRAAEFTQSSN